ncbi:type 1 glutamine amidotransferase [Geobacter sp. SVR]|uniref:type 1 glutamine amidotransferase n=1 Tax=Geobacter sp. SVR TaxID=2495594 RepID=UPI00143F040F|nr:type 1 glutamine amidotransferase [Geobacter sp. SVR]BCS52491.1 GMP synthase [Geobacter sp. SVR]GCF84072.1 GMP synthase [Geobacter sp. SVR]
MIHIIQNDAEVPPGLVTVELDRLGLAWRVTHPYRGEALPSPAAAEALIVMGGAMGANDDLRHPFLSDLKQLVRAVVGQGRPYLGICLGGQLLAAALGARVVSNRWEELGTLDVHLTPEGGADPLFSGIGGTFATFQWHHDSFDLPDGALLLATSPACPHQAFRVGQCAWGLQFHPEVTEEIIRDWCAWDPETRSRTDELLAAWQTQEDRYRAVVRQMIFNFSEVGRIWSDRQ